MGRTSTRHSRVCLIPCKQSLLGGDRVGIGHGYEWESCRFRRYALCRRPLSRLCTLCLDQYVRTSVCYALPCARLYPTALGNRPAITPAYSQFRVAAGPRKLVAPQPRVRLCSLAASRAASQSRSLTATLGPRSHTRELEASRTHSLAASRPRSLAAFRPRRRSRPAALQPHSLPRALAASQPPSRTGSLAAALAYWQPRSLPRLLVALQLRGLAPSQAGNLAASRPRSLEPPHS